jgi:hypothetical protein
MVSANRFIRTAVIPLIIVAYGVFLLIDHDYYNPVDAASRDHIQNIQKIGSIEGLLFGGSNVVYSLSAEFLSHYMGIKWYNASVRDELGTIEQHKNFIQNLSARIDRAKVRYVVYSSYVPYWTGIIARFESITIRIKIKPKTSILGYIRHQYYIRHQPVRFSEFPQRNRFGDTVFENVNCHFTAEHSTNHRREDVDISAEFLVEHAILFASLFPNASIFIVLPSEYYGALSFNDSIFEQTLRTKFYSGLKDTDMKIIFQPPYTSVKQVCDSQYHANEGGRLWRTRNLIELMREAVARTVPSATAQ